MVGKKPNAIIKRDLGKIHAVNRSRNDTNIFPNMNIHIDVSQYANTCNHTLNPFVTPFIPRCFRCRFESNNYTTGPIVCKNVQQKRPHYGRCITIKF